MNSFFCSEMFLLKEIGVCVCVHACLCAYTERGRTTGDLYTSNPRGGEGVHALSWTETACEKQISLGLKVSSGEGMLLLGNARLNQFQMFYRMSAVQPSG